MENSGVIHMLKHNKIDGKAITVSVKFMIMQEKLIYLLFLRRSSKNVSPVLPCQGWSEDDM